MSTSPEPKPKKSRRTKVLTFLLRWGIAVVGITWIVMQLTILDRVNVVMPDGLVKSFALAEPATDVSSQFVVKGLAAPVPRANVVSQPDRKTVKIHSTLSDATSAPIETPLLGMRLKGDLNKSPTVDELVVKDPHGAGGLCISPDDVVDGFKLQTPRPVVEKGLLTMGREANRWLLLLAIFVFPVTILLTANRWNQILHSQDIRIPFRSVIVLNMVGNFYNSFFPGSTGGDFLKAYYVSRQTTHKIRAMLSVFADRVIGLLALVILGGGASAFQYFAAPDKHSPTAIACGRVAGVCALITLGCVVGAAILASRRARTALGFDWFVSKLPMQHHLNKVREAGRIYRQHAVRMVWWIIITFPIHSTVVVSAMIAGHAFGLHIAWPYYFVCVPVMVLVASMPLSPQGAGVMEYFGFLLLAKQGATVSEVLALTLSIRFVQIFWNLVGGIFVLKGDFGATTKSYDTIADEDQDPEPTEDAGPRIPGTFTDQSGTGV